MANDLSFNQIATILNSINAQATGMTAQTITDTASFMSVANTVLQTGYDNLMNAVSQVLSRTIFSIRPYTRKLAAVNVSNQRYGNHVRKLQAIDKPLEDDERLPLTDNESVDMYRINKPLVLQTNYYGQNAYQKSYTLWRDQMDVAFSSPEELGRFITMVVQNVSDMLEQTHEGTARATLINYIGGIIADTNNPQRQIHLLTEYNDYVGGEFTPETIRQPENWGNFVRWMIARIRVITDLFTERTKLYHANITNKEVMRHTPYRNQRLYLLSSERHQINARVLSDIFNPDYLALSERENLNFWQSVDKHDSINAKVTYMKPDGTLDSTQEIEKAGIIGFLFDEESLGYTTVNQWSGTTPFNVMGGYSNTVYHFTERYWNDFTENAVVFLLD